LNLKIIKTIFDRLPLAADDLAPQQWKLLQASKGYKRKFVLEVIYIVFNVINTSTAMAVIPLPTPLWIQSYSVWQGSNQWESQVPSEIILLENLLNMDDIKLNEYGPLMLINPTTQHYRNSSWSNWKLLCQIPSLYSNVFQSLPERFCRS